ncbi:MAG: hypothetical protein H0V70_03620 [Ktedonobacteraceae bacterium]|nr:hypothetical protein [Ktedonobacteraceae bacterium]
MGKYSQWLYHREIDQQLRERLKHIEQELHTLQEQATLLGDAASSTDNSILQAIAMQQSAETLLEEASLRPTSQRSLTNGTKQSSMSVSSALFAWSSLPNFDSRKGIPSDEQQPEATQQTSLPHPEIHRPSPDLASLIEAENQTQPQLQLPGWLRKAQMTDRPNSGPDERTNTSIQRWLERWGKLVPDPPLKQQTPREGSET